MLDKTIFYYQPGLKRRCSWNFQIEPYTEKGLSQIFRDQLKKYNWLVDSDVELEKFFAAHLSDFPNYGGDTLRLAFYCKIVYATKVFDNKYPNEKMINTEIINEALTYLRNYRIREEKEKLMPLHMYS